MATGDILSLVKTTSIPNAPTTALMTVLLPAGTIDGVRVKLYGANASSNVVFNLNVNGTPVFGTELTVASGTNEIEQTGVATVVTNDDFATVSIDTLPSGGLAGVTAIGVHITYTSTSSVPFTAASASGAAYLDFAEDTDNGTNRVRLQGAASTADVTVTLPSTAGTLALTSDIPAGLSDGDKGDITVSSSGATWTIDNDVVTYAKMQNVSATSRILGRKTASAGDTEECTLSEILDFIGSAAQGDILYRGASGWARLGAGTSGQFLKTLGTGADPAWDTPAGSGDVSKVGTPVDNQVGVWTGSGTLEGDAALTFDTATDTLSVGGTIELGHASDTTLSRSSAGVLAVEGVTVPLNSTSSVHTASSIELGHASDTTLARVSAGVVSIEGNNIVTANNLGTGVLTQLGLAANGSDSDAIGFRGIPQNAQSGNYTLVLADAGKHIFHASGDGSGDTYTIPANASVAFEVGTSVTFVNLDSNNVTIAITTDTMYLGGTGTTGSRTLAQYGVATAIKVTSTSWVISGAGLT